MYPEPNPFIPTKHRQTWSPTRAKKCMLIKMTIYIYIYIYIYKDTCMHFNFQLRAWCNPSAWKIQFSPHGHSLPTYWTVLRYRRLTADQHGKLIKHTSSSVIGQKALVGFSFTSAPLKCAVIFGTSISSELL